MTKLDYIQVYLIHSYFSPIDIGEMTTYSAVVTSPVVVGPQFSALEHPTNWTWFLIWKPLLLIIVISWQLTQNRPSSDTFQPS